MANPIGPKSEGKTSSLTVEDYLRAEEREEEEEKVGAAMVDQTPDDAAEDLPMLICMTPRQIVSRWVKKLRHKKEKLPVAKTRTLDALAPHCPAEDKSLTITTLESGVSGQQHQQQEQVDSFKLGAGLGLALVVAASKNELDKMKELRKQMEMIVEDAKEELRCKSAAACNSSLACENPSYSTTNVDESINSNGRVSDPSCIGSRSSPYTGMKEESPCIEIDDQEWFRGKCKEGRGVSDGMAQLESELEAELQLLELQLDSTDTSGDIQDTVQESSGDGCETLGYDEEVNYTNDPIDNLAEAHYGSVPPQELERRLHELLEAQQLQRIKELEAALKRTKQKLRKKEVEVCWWKDTAHLISQHVSKTAPQNIPHPKDHQTHENF